MAGIFETLRRKFSPKAAQEGEEMDYVRQGKTQEDRVRRRDKIFEIRGKKPPKDTLSELARYLSEKD